MKKIKYDCTKDAYLELKTFIDHLLSFSPAPTNEDIIKELCNRYVSEDLFIVMRYTADYIWLLNKSIY